MHESNLPARDYTAWFNHDQDARRYTLITLVCYALLYGQFAFGLAGAIPLWTMCLTAPVLVVRWMFAQHELFHLRTAREVDPLTRLLPLMLTPISLGYKEYLRIHYGHHRHMATEDDPEYFQLRGGKISGFVNALTAPEQAFVRWVMRNPVDTELIIGTLLRLALFIGLVWIGGANFWWYWLPVRVAYGLAYFSFFYCLHRRGAEYGVYPIKLARWEQTVFGLLFGKDALLGTCYHDAHHRQPRVSAYRLPEVAL